MTEEDEAQASNSRAGEWDTSLDDEDNNDLLLLNDELNLNTSSLRSDKKYAGFDNNAGDSWIFPSNFPERAYQYNIVQKALFHNTLIVLPTGLGKTFIAAVVMYNIYRWYPMGKVIFMAPTRPLVAQQIEACVKIMGIPKEHSVELTGKLNKASRAQFWQSKRVFFATPQSVQSDILDEEVNFPFDAVKLIVVDEAHRAKGRYAYTEVIRYIWSKNKFFRILALSATPGRRKEDVEVVIRNLFISNLEVRTEESVDVVSYVHKRQLKVVVVDLGTKLSKIRDELLEIVDPHLRNLIDNRLISGRPGSISRNWLVMEHKRFREMTQNNSVPMQKELNSDFNICISVYHAIELLERHGLRVFLNNFDETQENGPKFVVILRPDLRRLIQKIRDEAGPNPFAYSDQCMLDGEIAPIPPNIDFGHPKFEIAREHVLAHFESNKEARVIVFCEYRESVMLMHRLLLQHRPVIRPRLFVGQGGCGSIRAVTQQQQINVMNDFKSGKSNALIATSVAEEGIDVGEVDLIVCFDINTSNPTRFIQRIGRTGRQKEGKVLLLATEGKEHAMLKEVLSERNKLNKSLSRGGQFNSAFYNQSPRMVPTEFNPKCMKLFIQVPQSEELPKSRDKASKRTAVKGNRFAQVTQKKDLRHFFKQRAPLDEEDRDVFAEAPSSSSKKPSPKTKTTKSSDLNETPAADSLDVSEAIVRVSPPPSPPVPKNTPANNKLFKKMAKYIRNTQNPQPVETLKAMTSNKLSKNSLQFLIEFSPDVLLKVWARMQELWDKGIDENNIPLRGVTNDDRLVIRAYLQIVNNFGSKESVAELVDAKKKLAKTTSYSALSEQYKSIFGDLEPGGLSENNFDYLMEKFDEISSDEFSKSSYVRSMVYEDEIDELNQTSSVFNETSHNYSNDYVMDSKYMSQWGDTTTSSSHVHQPASVNTVQNPITFTEPVVAPAPTNDSDDDDVVFVGSTTAHQSTPIRAGPHKQALLNFNGTPIISSALKRRSHKTPPAKTKNSQKNILDFVKASKMSPNIENTKRNPSNEVEPPSELNKVESQEENTMNFFDDQFDDIIAANSGILEHIENSNQVILSEKTLKDVPKPSTSRTTYVDQEKTPVTVVSKAPANLASDESTPDDIIPLVAETAKKTPNSTPTGVICSSSIRREEEQKRATPESQGKCEGVHSEVAGIDFDLSEFSVDDIIDSERSNPPVPKSLSHRCSPDIFAELCESISEQSKVPKEKSPARLMNSPPAQASPCLLTKKALTWREIREKYIKPSQVEQADTSRPADQPNESVITVPAKSRLKRRIITSDTESSGSDKDSPSIKRTRKSDMECCESITDSPSIRRPNRRIQSGRLLSRRSLQKVTHLRRRKTLKNDFIDDEAALSGSATEDEFEHTIGQYIQDSVIVDDDDSETESSVPMTQVYLQSVRSPSGNMRGGFKIPERRQYNDTLKIFSQQVPPEDNASYVTDSFVVISDDDDDEPDVEKSMCPLERAEEILKNKRRAKRRAKLDGITEECVQPAAKRKRVLRMHNSSEDDDDDFV